MVRWFDRVPSSVWALSTVLVWASLAPLGVSVKHLPPFLITGCGLIVGGALALPQILKQQLWRLDAATWIIGIYGLFGYHALLFAALQLAPPVAANLINYLWPMGIVVLAAWLIPGVRWNWGHAGAALLGFAGSAIAILGNHSIEAPQPSEWLGYGFALTAAFIWSTYSLLTKRRAHVPTGAIGALCLVAGSLSLVMHWLFEVRPTLGNSEVMVLLLLGLGPVGGAFFLWDLALKKGDARQVGLWAFLTPVLSTGALAWQSGQALQWQWVAATVLVVASAALGRWAGADSNGPEHAAVSRVSE
jgi:drug/metabolite transporter (DMT)-like permease